MKDAICLPRLSILVKPWVALSNLNFLKGTSGSCSRGIMVFDSPQPGKVSASLAFTSNQLV